MQIISYKAGNRLGIPSIQVNDNYIQSKCKVDTLDIIHRWLEKNESRYVKVKNTVVQKVNFLTWWQTLWVWVGKIVSGLIALVLLWFILRKTFPFLGTFIKFF